MNHRLTVIEVVHLNWICYTIRAIVQNHASWTNPHPSEAET